MATELWVLEAGAETFRAEDVGQLQNLLVREGPVRWVHMTRTDDFADLARQAGLPQVLVKEVAAERRRTRTYEPTQHIAVTLLRCGAETAADLGEGTLGERLERLDLVVGRGWILSVGSLSDEERKELAERARHRSTTEGLYPGVVLALLAAWTVEGYEDVIDQIDSRFDGLENEILSHSRPDIVRGLFRLKQNLVTLRRQLNALRETLGQVAADEASLLAPPVERQLRISHTEVIYSLEHLDAYRDILTAALELHQSVVSNRLNEVMRRLTLIATIFMPITFITGFFGMNFHQIPYASTLWFILIMASMPGSLALLWVVLRNQNGSQARGELDGGPDGMGNG